MYNKERRVIRMDFGTWSPSHTILVLVVLVAFIGQVAVYFYRTAQNDKKIERLEEQMDKREQIDKWINGLNKWINGSSRSFLQ